MVGSASRLLKNFWNPPKTMVFWASEALKYTKCLPTTSGSLGNAYFFQSHCLILVYRNSESLPSTGRGLKLMAEPLVSDMHTYGQPQYIIISAPQEGTIELYLQVSAKNETPGRNGNDTAGRITSEITIFGPWDASRGWLVQPNACYEKNRP